MADEPAVSLRRATAEQALSLSQAFRAATVDVPKDLSTGHHLMGMYEPDNKRWGAAYVVRAQSVTGVVTWEQGYDGRGRRLTASLSITPGST